ncbi:MAG: SGNH/GDSL hydrolase family protein [Burkholderiales bacterium]
MANGPYWDEGLMKGMGDFPEIVAIGDSWFWYPLNNLLIPIWNLWGGNKDIFALGVVGAEAEELAEGWYLKNFRRILKGYPGIQAVLISAGGNDFAGQDDMSAIFSSPAACAGATTGAECFDPAKLDKLMFGTVLRSYRTLLDEVESNAGQALVFLHNYDYALPTGIGFLGFGKWLKYPMDQIGIPVSVQSLAVNYLLDTFNNVLAQVQGEYADRTFLVDSSGVLSPGDWANELHPTMSGFNKIVEKAWQRPLLENLP